MYKKNKDVYDPILTKPLTKKESIPAFVLLFGACQDDETAKEWGENGIFTGVVKKITESPFVSYVKFFEEIKKNVPRRLQVPNLFKYGNAAFDFSKQAPFFIGGKTSGGSDNGKAQTAKK